MSYQDPITVSGSLVTFNDPDGDGRITNLSAAISPIQDLHGYSHPWPAGGGKNLFDPESTGNTWVGLNGEIITKGSCKSVKLSAEEGQSWTASMENTRTATNLLIVVFLDNADNMLERNLVAAGEKVVTGTAPADTAYILCSAYTYSEAGNVQLERGSSATTFAPYSNICPISGRTGLSVYRTGVNVWDESYRLASLNLTTGTWGSIGTYSQIASTNMIPVMPNAVYYFNSSNLDGMYIAEYRADGSYIGYVRAWSTNRAITIPADCHYVMFQMNNYGTTYNHDISINYPSTDTSYHAYQGNLYSVNWSTQAGTVYHGTVDPVAGQLTVDWVMYTFDGSEAWTASATPHRFSTNINYLPHPIATQPMTQGATQNVLTSVFGECVFTNADGVGYIVHQSSISLFVVNESAATTVDDIKAIVTGMQFCYELATPLTYQLTPQEVEALLGTNNIWADAGDVTVTYQLARHGFEGWLIKVGTEQTEIPLNFIRYSTYKVTPDQRMEWSAERNVNGVLQRETVPNMPPKIEFNTKLLTNSDVTALMSILNKSFTVASERKLPVYFYDPENNTYKTCDCYMPDIDFKIRNVDTVKNIINYEELRFAFIGY